MNGVGPLRQVTVLVRSTNLEELSTSFMSCHGSSRRKSFVSSCPILHSTYCALKNGEGSRSAYNSESGALAGTCMKSKAGYNSDRGGPPRLARAAGREARRNVRFTTVHALQAINCLHASANCLRVVSERYGRIGVTSELRDEADFDAISLEHADEGVTRAVRGDHRKSERGKCRPPVCADEVVVAQRPPACLSSYRTAAEARKHPAIFTGSFWTVRVPFLKH